MICENYGRESVNGACLPSRPPAHPLGLRQYPGALKGCGVKTHQKLNINLKGWIKMQQKELYFNKKNMSKQCHGTEICSEKV